MLPLYQKHNDEKLISLVAGSRHQPLVSEFLQMIWGAPYGYSIEWKENDRFRSKRTFWDCFGIKTEDLPAYIDAAKDFQEILTIFPYLKTRMDFLQPAIALQKELRPLALKLIFPGERLEIIPKILTLPENDREAFCLRLLEKFTLSGEKYLTVRIFVEHYEEYWFTNPHIRALCKGQENEKKRS